MDEVSFTFFILIYEYFLSFMACQKEYEKIGRMLSGVNKGGKDRNTVIAYGAGKFNHASPGHAATPIKHLCVQLKKQFLVRLMNEYNTSKVCSGMRRDGFVCESELIQHDEHWRLKYCPISENSCSILWHHDVNPACNIR